MRPTVYISAGPVKSSSFPTKQILPRNIRCPKGTILVRRIQKEDISMENVPLWVSPTITSSQKSIGENVAQPAQGHQVATLAMRTKNTGVQGNINLWGPEVAANQFSSALIFAASDEGSVQNYIATGWSVNSALYPNYTRLHVFWTKDSGQTTGCFNLLCPGFVQVSQNIAPGVILQPLSTFGGSQFEIPLNIRQDTHTGNWWVSLGDKNIGYYPQELFTTLKSGADGVGWGGEISSPTTEALPGMGSSHFPELGPGKACYISHMQLFSNSGQVIYPDANSVINYASKSECYKVKYVGDNGGQSGHYMFFGGPPDCQI
ncbi:protein neprosin-like [Silene latifolia]|uniref:protein neprosin-like n=1 Tax=Silene latifolia TaxID=37657 RepID=UPI003D78400A